MTGWNAIGGDGIYIEILRSVVPQLEQIQIECVSKQDVGRGGGEGGPIILYLRDGAYVTRTRLQLTRDMFIAGYFMLLFDLTPELATSECHISLPDRANIRLELQFDKPLTEVTCLLYTEYENSVHIHELRTFNRLIIIMDTAQMLCTLKDVPSFLGVYPSVILPPHSITQSAILIVSAHS
jgi:hypothetical protein